MEIDLFLRAGEGGGGGWAGPAARWLRGPGQPLIWALMLFIQV